MMTKVLIIGAGDLGRQVADKMNEIPGYEVSGFVDDTKKKGINLEFGLVLGSIDDLLEGKLNHQFDEVTIAIGYKHLNFKQNLYKKIKSKYKLATLIHPTVYIGKNVKISEGVTIFPNCIIDSEVCIEPNTFINIDVTISHHTKVADSSFLAPSTKIAGFVRIGSRNFLGINSTISDNISTVDGVILGASATLIHSVTKPGVYVGIPAKLKT